MFLNKVDDVADDLSGPHVLPYKLLFNSETNNEDIHVLLPCFRYSKIFNLFTMLMLLTSYLGDGKASPSP